MVTMVKTPVTFIASRVQNEPLVVSFFTKKGGVPVASEAVKRVKTKKGIRLYTYIQKTTGDNVKKDKNHLHRF